ncbi:MAG: hypothetical protein ACAH17_01660 [Candidatus Paceibacterota bacterium]
MIATLSFILNEVLPNTSSSQTIQTNFSAIDAFRKLDNLPTIQSQPLIVEFKKAVRRTLPFKSRFSLSTYNVRTVIDHIRNIPSPPPSSSLKHLIPLRLKCLILTRAVALLRSSDASQIIRSSIKISKDSLDRDIVIFFYRGKNASINQIDIESNYLEFLPGNPLCPAKSMLEWKKAVDSISPPHDFLFISVKKPHQALSKDRTAKLVTILLSELDILHTSHSLRGASNDFLRLAGVPSDDRDLRGGWKRPNCNMSPTQRLKYSSRISRLNFAELICSPQFYPNIEDLKDISAEDEQTEGLRSRQANI